MTINLLTHRLLFNLTFSDSPCDQYLHEEMCPSRPNNWAFAEDGQRAQLQFLGEGVDWEPGQIRRHATGVLFRVVKVFQGGKTVIGFFQIIEPWFTYVAA